MQILDEPLVRPPSAPIWSTVLRYGVYCGIAFIVAAQIFYHLNIASTDIAGFWVHFGGLLLLCLATAYFSIKRQRDQLDHGFIGFGKAALLACLSVYLAFFILGIWNYLFINFFEPEYLQSVRTQLIATWQGKLSPNELEQVLANVENMQSFPMILKNSLMYESPVGILGGLVIAFFMSGKK
jgi:hypothetical protein